MSSPDRTAQSVITDFFLSKPSLANPHNIVSASPANPHSVISSLAGSPAVSQQTYRSPHSIVPTSDTGLSSYIRSPQTVSPQTDKSSKEQVNHDAQVLAGSLAVWFQSTNIYSPPPPPPQHDEKQQQQQQEQQQYDQQGQTQSHPMESVHVALNSDPDHSTTPIPAQTEVIGNKPTWKKMRKCLWIFVVLSIIMAVVFGVVFGAVL